MVVTHKRVLVVDDEAIVCESYKRVLTDAGYSVCTAQNGRDALEACRDKPFDVMLTDLKMPDMDGLEVTRKIKNEFPRVQVLIVTGYPTEQSAQDARGLGVFDYLNKPLSPERLNAVTAAAAAAPAVADVLESTEVRPVTPSTQPAAVEIGAVATGNEESTLKVLTLLAAAPLIGVAYVMFLPILGFGMLLAVVGGGLATKFGLMKS